MDVIVTIAEYKNQMKVIGYAENTIESYSRGLNLFKEYLAEINLSDLRKVTRSVISNYHEKVMSESIEMESKAVKIRPVKRLFEYLANSHKLLINPTEGIKETNRKNRKIGTVLTIEEMKDLLSQPNLSLNVEIRDRAVMELMYSTGIRVNELVNLEVYHVDLKDQVLYIKKGKGKNQRVVPIGNHAVKFLKEYLEKIRPNYSKKNPKTRFLFLTGSGRPIDRGCVSQFLRKYKTRANIKKPVSAHVFRRSFATHMLQQGSDIRYIQEILGHRHLKTTQYYTKVMPVDLKKTHEKAHPNHED